MIKQIKTLAKLQLCNICNINVARYSKDKRKRNLLFGLGAVWTILIIMLCFYVGALSYGFVYLGIGSILPSYLIAITSVIILFFSMLKTGSVIFEKNSYDTLCSLPVSQSAIVISRFIKMYISNLLLAIAVMLPGMAVYAYLTNPGVSFYLISIIGTFFIPLLPITIASFFGAIITAISSRLKHKSIVSAVLSLLLVLGIMLGSSGLSSIDTDSTEQMLENISGILSSLIGKIYPPAVWLGNAITGAGTYKLLIYIAVSVIFFVAIISVVSAKFHAICRRLYSISARHNYKMTTLKGNSVLAALFKREFKRYTASGIYMTNTACGPVLAVIFSGVVLFTGADKVFEIVPSKLNSTGLIIMIFSAILCIMTTTSTSISLEGTEWWISKSLPINPKMIINSKILLNIAVFAPFYVLSEILLLIALKPGFSDTIWLIIMPMVFSIFAFVFGIFINLAFPVFNWENEVTIVKQSVSSALGGLGGCVIIIIISLPMIFSGFIPYGLSKPIVCIAVLGITYFLYKKSISKNFLTLGE